MPPAFLLLLFILWPCTSSSQVAVQQDECPCYVKTIDAYNNYLLFPRLEKLLRMGYFQCYKVNLKKPCPFWNDANEKQDEDDEMESKSYKYSKEANIFVDCKKALGPSDASFSEETQHGHSEDSFYDADDTEYANLLERPEARTNYNGTRIWNSIYEHNIFKPPSIKRPLGPSKPNSVKKFYIWLEGLPEEKRAVYRLISGLHASISVHISARYREKEIPGEKQWERNVTEFLRRFDKVLTQGEGPRRLENLYYIYLVELRALSKVLPFFERSDVQLGNAETKKLLLEILRIAKCFPSHFDEKSFFTGDPTQAAKLKEEVSLRFRNISRLMDCVGCPKCRLWAKLQTQGLGTALKILFSGQKIESISEKGSSPKFQLTRQEIVSLINAFGRLSTSIRELGNFRNILWSQQ